jgi:hypothetical protein
LLGRNRVELSDQCFWNRSRKGNGAPFIWVADLATGTGPRASVLLC